MIRQNVWFNDGIFKMPKMFALFACAMLVSFAARAADDDMSLIDLFGEEPKKEEKVSVSDKPERRVEPENKKEEEKVKVDDEGMFSFLNFSFLKNKKKVEEFARKPDEPQENFLDRMTRLAEEGDVDACLTLGYMYLYGENGVTRDEEKAFRYYSMAASQEDMIAVNNLGSLYYSGIGTEKNVNKAVEMFDKAAKLGNKEAAINLAFIYLTSPSSGVSSNRIVELLQQAAEGGNITAQYMMGYSYYRGFVVAKDFKKAFDLIKQAAVSYDEAQYELAQRYINAEGTPRNYGNAVKYLTQAAHQGNVQAMMDLGNILAAGTSYQKNEYQAYIWFNIASVYGIEGAAEKRDALEKILKIEEVLQAQAAAETFKEKPSEMTQYIRQTFGRGLGGYIDKKMGYRAPKKQPPATVKKQERDPSQPLKLL